MMVLTFNGTDHGKRDEALRKTADRVGGTARVPARTEPAMDVLEQADSLTIKLNVPGARAEQVEIGLEKQVLTITVHASAPAEEGRYLLRERREGAVTRTVTLPYEVDGSETKATCRDGVLTLVLPKVRRNRNIRINVD